MPGGCRCYQKCFPRLVNRDFVEDPTSCPFHPRQTNLNQCTQSLFAAADKTTIYLTTKQQMIPCQKCNSECKLEGNSC